MWCGGGGETRAPCDARSGGMASRRALAVPSASSGSAVRTRCHAGPFALGAEWWLGGGALPLLGGAGLLVVECKTLDNVYGLTATGKTINNGQLVMKSYVPGDCGFDPLNLDGYFGQTVGVMEKMRGDTDPAYAFELAEEARRQMETTELKNGR